MGPESRHTSIEDTVQVRQQFLRHDDGTVDGHGKGLQVAADDRDDVLQPLQFLEQEDVQRCAKTLVGGVRWPLQLRNLRAEDLRC